MYFSDHGGVGLIAFPSGPYLMVQDLQKALNTMHAKRMYSQLTFYLEACESGSMFNGWLRDNVTILATTASSPSESSWGAFCSPNDYVNGKVRNGCCC